MRKLLRRDGEELQLSAMFYRAVVQSVLIFGVNIWVLSEAMYRNMEGVNVIFLSQITG